ncbi:MAG TPA: serine/threonine-protein kinase [Jatrophihabitans sp.]|jgi:tRNA A-37 threonylcarbamoyl transferase component Bud32|uniref:serine/threonine-protein kinase n=1 Tax=Jatrophihabitans sp. TaxID=1932789 RepID=UPI002F0A3ABE
MAFSVPGYQVDQLIGYGSHAEVWSGRAAGTDEAVALKRIIVPAHGDPDRAAELIRSARCEAALLTALEHPSLIRLRRYVQTPAAVVLVMELAEGGSLAQLLRRRDRLSPAEVAAALSPVAAALAFAHGEGVLHGDVSAGNILFSAAGQPKLADLGVARMLIGHAEPDRALGTPAYLDPVVAAGGAAGTASDVFSLAAVALHCLTGSGPWHSADPADLRAVLDRAATGVIDDLPGKLAGCPAAMAAVVSRALDPEPSRRGSAAEFALDLGASVPSAPVVLAAGRVLPGIGRHSAERHDPVAAGVVPADLTHVARLQVRPEPAEPAPRRRLLHRLASRTAARTTAPLVVAVLCVAVAAIAVLALVAVRSHGRPTLAAGPPATSAAHASSAAPATSAAQASSAAPVAPAVPGLAATPARSTLPTAPAPIDPETVLRKLADLRAEAFARGRPELLAAIYESPTLLAQDLGQLRTRIPVGCGLTGLRTEYQDIAVTSASPQRLELQVTASQPPASLVCAGTVRSRTLPAAPTRLALSLVRVGAEFRITSQRPGGAVLPR